MQRAAMPEACRRIVLSMPPHWPLQRDAFQSGTEGPFSIGLMQSKRKPVEMALTSAASTGDIWVTCYASVLVPVGTLGAYVSLLLGRATAVRTRDVLLALGLGAHLAIIPGRGLLTSTGTEGDSTALDDGIYVVSTELVAHCQ